MSMRPPDGHFDGPSQPFGWDELPRLFPEFAGADVWLPRLQRHAELVAAAAGHVRVTAVPPVEQVRRHYAESLELLRMGLSLASPGSIGPVADVGSGGGYPGLVIAAVLPGVTVHLIEPLQKRARMLVEWASAMGMGNVHVHPQRAEEAGRGPLREQCALVVARAVAAMPELLEYTVPLAAPGGHVLLPKGSALEAELATAANALARLGGELIATTPMRKEISDAVVVAAFAKVQRTPDTYPRPPGMPGKRPL
jgi:16S rRNA (guanine527-N7)-methyltransferase